MLVKKVDSRYLLGNSYMNKLAIVLSFVFPFQLYNIILNKVKWLRSIWIMSFFKSCDYSVRFSGLGDLKGMKYISIGISVFLTGFSS